MIVGGSEAKVHPLSLSRFNLFAVLEAERRPRGASARSTATATAPHPARNGGVHPRSAESRLARKAKVYAEVCSVASGVDRTLSGPGYAA